jgi:hypothetical protein
MRLGEGRRGCKDGGKALCGNIETTGTHIFRRLTESVAGFRALTTGQNWQQRGSEEI